VDHRVKKKDVVVAEITPIPAPPSVPNLRRFLVQSRGQTPEQVLASGSALLGGTKELFLALCAELGVEISFFAADQTPCGGDWEWLRLQAKVKLK